MRPTRREALRLAAGLLAARAPAAGPAFRLAICNETFERWSFADACRGARTTGYTGLEIAPFTLAEDPASIPKARRSELRDVMRSEGVEYAGLHSLLTTPKGLHVTTPDAAVRRRSWEYFRKLIDLCADLGDGGVMVLGSGRQRSTTGGSTVEDAAGRLREGLAEAAPAASDRGVTILLEALAPHLADVVTSLDEAVLMVEQIGSPAVQSMFDTHNAAEEELPHGELIRKHYRHIRHVHVNEMDGRHPGTGSYDFKPVLQALKDVAYDRWISLEVFDFSAGPMKIASDSERLLRRLEAELL